MNDFGAVTEDSTITITNGESGNLSGSYDTHDEHSGDILSNDTDPDASPTHTITAVRIGSTAGSGTAGTVGSALTGVGASEEDTAVSSTSATTVLSFAKATYRAAFIKVLVTQGSAYQSGKYSLIHDGTTVTVVEENAIATGSMLGSFSGTISGDNVLFQVTMGSASSATVTILKDLVTV